MVHNVVAVADNFVAVARDVGVEVGNAVVGVHDAGEEAGNAVVVAHDVEVEDGNAVVVARDIVAGDGNAVVVVMAHDVVDDGSDVEGAVVEVGDKTAQEGE